MGTRLEAVDNTLDAEELAHVTPIGVHFYAHKPGQRVTCTNSVNPPVDIFMDDRDGHFYGTCPGACKQMVKFQYNSRSPQQSGWRTDFQRHKAKI